ncbi:MAG: hypothetical protein HYV28_13055 [Ignavibacteriales bacterium]|nr:hypothetical protein [Ignavibacteriales bacterium]
MKAKRMTNKEAKEFTNEVFAQIQGSKTIEDLMQTEKMHEKSKIMKTIGYPSIEFSISTNEIEQLVKDELLNGTDFSFSRDITSKIKDPLAKLLYAAVWKNGDTVKIKHIVKGIIDVGDKNENYSKALVFYQFGRYLTNTA